MVSLAVIGLIVLALLVAALAGAAAGVRLAGKDLGNALAAMMGAFFGPTAVVPATLVGLLVLMWLK